MANEVVFAVAGGGKTESIIQRCTNNPRRRLVITFTEYGQRELRDRLAARCPAPQPEVTGWYGFLIQHFVKPYISDAYPNRKYEGFNYEYNPAPRTKRGEAKYFDNKGRIGREGLAYVARLICTNGDNSPIKRLEKIYEEVVIDELQDLAASDLEILELLMNSSIDLYMVGDLRQTVYETTQSDRKNKKFRKTGKLEWYNDKARQGLISITEENVNYRSNQEIVDLANSIFPASLGFPLARSEQSTSSSIAHAGLFQVAPSMVEDYIARYSPLVLRWDRRAGKKFEAFTKIYNFGDVKGTSADHVLIVPTDGLVKFLKNNTAIEAPTTQSKIYVAVTRARHSVAFILDSYIISKDLTTWEP